MIEVRFMCQSVNLKLSHGFELWGYRVVMDSANALLVMKLKIYLKL